MCENVKNDELEEGFSSVEDCIEAFKRGEFIVVTDDHRRENEGDLIVAAELATPDKVNFMVTHARGLLCVPMKHDQLEKLGLSRMASKGGDPYQTAFMDSVDAREGVTTGISAADRAYTIQLLINEDTQPRDLHSPGHVFPLEAVEGGVLRRPGHTEAAVDLAALAGLKLAGAICEIMREDGQMARLPDLKIFARKHKLHLMSIADLAAYRRATEKLVHCERSVPLPLASGAWRLHLYHSLIDDQHHVAMVMGEPEKQDSALVRIHSECLTGDVFGSMRCDCGIQLHEAMDRIAKEGHGVLLYMRQEGRGIGLAHKIHAYQLQDEGMDTVEANIHLGFDADLRDYGSGAQILADLGLKRLRLMTNNPRKIEGLERYGLQITQRESIVIPHGEHNKRYLSTKKEKMGHLI